VLSKSRGDCAEQIARLLSVVDLSAVRYSEVLIEYIKYARKHLYKFVYTNTRAPVCVCVCVCVFFLCVLV
jgi:hypothetical protein